MLYGLVALAILGVVGGIGYKVRESGYDACKVEWQAANELQRQAEAEKSAKASTSLEKGNAKAKIVYRTITRDVDKVVDRVEYRDVCFDDDGLRVANRALLGPGAAGGQPDGTVPGPDPARAGNQGGGAAETR